MTNMDLSIIKGLLTNKKIALDFISENPDAQLFAPSLWNFANIVVNYIKIYKDIPTKRVLLERLPKGNSNLVDMVNNVWSEVEKVEFNEKEFKHELEKMKKRYAEKQLSALKDYVTKLEPGSMDVSKALSEMQRTSQNIKNLNKVKSYERKTLKDSTSSFKEEYHAKLKDANFDRGLLTGYSFLDHVTDGLRPGELMLIGGESGGGKSMLLMNIALQMWMGQNTIDTLSDFKPGNNVLYFSLEMPFKPCLNRVLSRLSGNASKKIRAAKLDASEADKLKKTLKFINNYPYEFEIIDIPRGATVENLELIYEEAKAHFTPNIVVIDYLGLMDYEDADMEDWLKLGKISEKIHEFARVHNCIVLSAVQLNRTKGAKEEDRIGLHRIGRSALIMQNANIAVQIESRPNEKNYPDMIYHIIKNRDGELGAGKLLKNLACGTLLDEKVEEDPTTFEMYDVNDISEQVELLDI